MSAAAGLRVSPVDAAAAGLDRVLARLRAAWIRYVDARSRLRDFVHRAELPWS